MCGIYGIIDKREPVTKGFIEKRRDLLSHRGPDDAGAWISSTRMVGFAQRRLSILDLSPKGHQPMMSRDGHLSIVFNGEIFNFRELRAILKKSGFIFESDTDTEVVLAAYQFWGEDCLAQFNGMFSLAIYDSGRGQTSPSVFFARDRAGEKPFYYFYEGHRFQFASELKAIAGVSGVDSQALNCYLALGYVPGELCFARGVRKLPPAHAARLDLKSLNLKIWKYWDLPRNTSSGKESGEELADKVFSLLTDSVKLRLTGDVPLGVLLSGGMDSSLITAIAADNTKGRIKTFTISFPGTKYDESSHAYEVARYFNTDHIVLDATNTTNELLEEIAPFVDEPLADSSVIPSYTVSKLTRKHVTVALGGDGGDELFGGYSDYSQALSSEKYLRFIPPGVLQALAKSVSRLPAGIKGRGRIGALRGGALQQIVWGTPYFDDSLRRRILDPGVVAGLGAEFTLPESMLLSAFMTGSDSVDRMTRAHFHMILPDDFLVKVDRASMANSLEARAPYLDHRLIEYTFSNIPSVWKVGGNKTRRIQRILAKRILPADLELNRKQGFSFPVNDWLRTDNCCAVRKYAGYLSDYVNTRELEAIIDGHMRGRANGSRLFSLIMLGIAIKNQSSN